MGAALITDEHRVALGEVARSCRVLHDLDQPAVGVLPVAGGDALGDDVAPRVLANVDHLCARVGLLVVVCEGHGVKLANRVVTLQDDTRVFPGDG